MPFTLAVAKSRLESGFPSSFTAGATDAQKIQRINEALDLFYEYGTWRGLRVIVPLTTTGGILTLASAYERLDGLGVASLNCIVPIQGQQYQFSPGALLPQDWTLSSELLALDQGDTAGVRSYQITGNTTSLDALAFTGEARRRFTWLSDTAAAIYPDSYSALVQGVQALNWRDAGDGERYAASLAEALRILNGDVREFNPQNRQAQLSPVLGLGGRPCIH